jgi:hypothetical protein
MTTETQGAPTGAAATATTTGDTTGATTPALIPGSSEHRDAMIAAYDAQFKKEPAQAATQSQTAAQPQTDPAKVEPNAPAPKLTDEPKVEGEKKDGEGAPATLGALIESGDLLNGLAGEKVPENIATALKGMGVTDDQLAALNTRLRSLVTLEATTQTQGLHKLAGGAEQFNALVAWGQKNLTPEQRSFYDTELNGPNASDAIALLQRRMAAGGEPQLHNVTASASVPAQGFRDKTEMMEAMRDPRYQTSDAFRADVTAKLKASRF